MALLGHQMIAEKFADDGSIAQSFSDPTGRRSLSPELHDKEGDAMNGRVAGKVALVTGAARGQGRAHALGLAAEGADLILLDLPPRPGADGPDDLDQTVAMVEESGRRARAFHADVRDQQAVTSATDAGVAEFGRLDIVIGNAGVLSSPGPLWEMSDEQWRLTIEVNLTGIFHVIRATVPHLIAGDRGGSIILVSSAGGLKGNPGFAAYSASKHGVVGLMRSLAGELGPYGIRVNTLNPGSVNTGMIVNEAVFKASRPDLDAPEFDDVKDNFASTNLLPVPWLEPVDIANAAIWLASDEARYVTGIVLPVDAGLTAK